MADGCAEDHAGPFRIEKREWFSYPRPPPGRSSMWDGCVLRCMACGAIGSPYDGTDNIPHWTEPDPAFVKYERIEKERAEKRAQEALRCPKPDYRSIASRLEDVKRDGGLSSDLIPTLMDMLIPWGYEGCQSEPEALHKLLVALLHAEPWDHWCVELAARTASRLYELQRS